MFFVKFCIFSNPWDNLCLINGYKDVDLAQIIIISKMQTTLEERLHLK